MYEQLNPTFFIGILDFNITQNSDYISRHKILDVQTGENLISDIEFNFIELPKFNKNVSELNSIIDQWVYFIKNAEDLEVIPENINDEGLKFAYEDADKHNWTKAELEAYDYVLMREQDDRGRLTKVQKDIARNFLNSGLSVEIVAQNTGLAIEEAIKLQR